MGVRIVGAMWFDLLLPEMNPVIKDGVGVAAGREHVDCFENAHQDRAAGRRQWSADNTLRQVSVGLQVSQVENANHIEPDAKLHLETPDDGDGKSTQDHIGEDVAGWLILDLVGHGDVVGAINSQMFQYTRLTNRLKS